MFGSNLLDSDRCKEGKNKPMVLQEDDPRPNRGSDGSRAVLGLASCKKGLVVSAVRPRRTSCSERSIGKRPRHYRSGSFMFATILSAQSLGHREPSEAQPQPEGRFSNRPRTIGNPVCGGWKTAAPSLGKIHAEKQHFEESCQGGRK